jgi:hypothetical protein
MWLKFERQLRLTVLLFGHVSLFEIFKHVGKVKGFGLAFLFTIIYIIIYII